jgi:hypothetical protein
MTLPILDLTVSAVREVERHDRRDDPLRDGHRRNVDAAGERCLELAPEI